jgi:hypothetical protein
MALNNSIHWTNIMTESQQEELRKSPEFKEWLLGVLKDDNKSTVVTFKKKDGTIRKMHCTRNPTLIPEDQHPKNESTESSTSIRVFDIEKQEWRSFIIENVMSVDYEF